MVVDTVGNFERDVVEGEDEDEVGTEADVVTGPVGKTVIVPERGTLSDLVEDIGGPMLVITGLLVVVIVVPEDNLLSLGIKEEDESVVRSVTLVEGVVILWVVGTILVVLVVLAVSLGVGVGGALLSIVGRMLLSVAWPVEVLS